MDRAGRTTVSIYQNPEHVSGILQQLYQAPLVIRQQEEQFQEQSRSAGAGGEADIDAKAGVKLPFIGEVGVNAGGKGMGQYEQGDTTGWKLKRDFVYSEATYLYLVREQLRKTEQLKVVTGAQMQGALIVGDYVEYQATFRPNEINTLLDIVTPDLVAEIARYLVHQKGLDLFDAGLEYGELTNQIKRNDMVAKAKGELAHAIATAVRVDFRSEDTREFYGEIGDGDDRITAVTICESEHFLVNDYDRILDGHFTVLGKIISTPQNDVPVLDRNKILERFQPKAMDKMSTWVREAVESAGPLEKWETPTDQVFDFTFSSRVEGPSFRVIPIAIYV